MELVISELFGGLRTTFGSVATTETASTRSSSTTTTTSGHGHYWPWPGCGLAVRRASKGGEVITQMEGCETLGCLLFACSCASCVGDNARRNQHHHHQHDHDDKHDHEHGLALGLPRRWCGGGDARTGAVSLAFCGAPSPVLYHSRPRPRTARRPGPPPPPRAAARPSPAAPPPDGSAGKHQCVPPHSPCPPLPLPLPPNHPTPRPPLLMSCPVLY